MTMKVVKVDDGDVVNAINVFFKGLLENGKIDALMVPQAVPSKRILFPILISDPARLDCDVIAPVMPVTEASLVSKMTKLGGSDRPIGIVLRPCQSRALVELEKLNQVNLDNVISIGVDCLGTFPVKTYDGFQGESTPTQFLLDSTIVGNEEATTHLRSACMVCKDPVPLNADIIIGLFGADLMKELLIDAPTDAGKRLLEGLSLEDASDTGAREAAVADIRKKKDEARTKFITERCTVKGIDALAEFFDKCVNCHNCMKACPICYCNECLFDSPVLDREANKFVQEASSKGLFKMPTDTLLFQLGRMNHMILSCVQCGLCEQACPNDIPLMEVFIPAAERAQEEFGYHPGADPKEKLPLVVYREDEYLEVGEK